MTENLSGINLLWCPLVIFLKISIDLGLVWDMPVIGQDIQVKLKKFLRILYTVQQPTISAKDIYMIKKSRDIRQIWLNDRLPALAIFTAELKYKTPVAKLSGAKLIWFRHHTSWNEGS